MAVIDPRTMVDANDIAGKFVNQYYHCISESPETAHKFYTYSSVLSRPEKDGTMTTLTTLEEIRNAIMTFGYKSCKTKIINTCAQQSLDGGVIVGVVGRLTRINNDTKIFAQKFFFFKQDQNTFTILNDMLQFVDVDEKISESETELTQDATITQKFEQHISTPTSILEENVSDDCESNSNKSESNKTDIEQQLTIDQVTEKQIDVKLLVVEDQASERQDYDIQFPELASYIRHVSTSTVLEDSQKVSYALMVNTVPSPSHKPVKIVKVSPNINSQSSTSLSTTKDSHYVTEVEATSIYISSLPTNVTPQIIESAVKKFGLIRTNGIHIKHSGLFCYAFVHFQSPASTRKACEAKYIEVENKKCYIQYKKSNSHSSVADYEKVLYSRQ